MNVQHILAEGDCCGESIYSNPIYTVNTVNDGKSIPADSEKGDHVNTLDPSQWTSFSFEPHSFENHNPNGETFPRLQESIRNTDGIEMATFNPQTNNNTDINNCDIIEGSSIEDYVNIRMVDESYPDPVQSPEDILIMLGLRKRVKEPIPETVKRLKCKSQILSSAANVRNSEDDLMIKYIGTYNEGDDGVEQGCFCWPLVHLIYRVRYSWYKRRIKNKMKRRQTRI